MNNVFIEMQKFIDLYLLNRQQRYLKDQAYLEMY